MIVVASTTAYLVIVHPNVRIIPIVLGIFGYTYGSLLGVFFAGMLTKTRGNDRGNILAMIIGFFVVAILSGLPNNIAGIFGAKFYEQPGLAAGDGISRGGSSSERSSLFRGGPVPDQAPPSTSHGAAIDFFSPASLIAQIAQLPRIDSPGDCDIRSMPRLFFGKAITSRMLSSPQISMTSRSRPSAMPPCGGAPRRNARSIWPNIVC